MTFKLYFLYFRTFGGQIISLLLQQSFPVGIHPFLPRRLPEPLLPGLARLQVFVFLFEVVICHCYFSFKNLLIALRIKYIIYQ